MSLTGQSVVVGDDVVKWNGVELRIAARGSSIDSPWLTGIHFGKGSVRQIGGSGC